MQKKLSTAKHDTSKLVLLANIGSLYSSQGKPDLAAKYIQQASKLNDQLGWKRGAMIFKFSEAEVAYNSVNMDGALASYQQALKLAEEVGHERIKYNSIVAIGRTQAALNQPEAALKSLNTALSYYQQKKNDDGASLCLNVIGYIYQRQNKLDEALAAYEQSLQLAKAAGKAHSIYTNELALAGIYMGKQDYKKALTYIIDAEPRLKGYEVLSTYTDYLGLAAGIYGMLGNTDKAMDYYLQLAKVAEKRSSPFEQAKAYMGMGTIYSGLSEERKSIAYFTRALHAVDGIKNTPNFLIVRILSSIASQLSQLKEYDQARVHYLRMIDLAENKAVVVQIMNSVAWDYFEQKKYHQAYTEAAKALEIAQKNNISHTYLLGTMGSILRDAPDDVLIKNGIPANQRNAKMLQYLLAAKDDHQKTGNIYVLSDDYRELSLAYEKANNYEEAFKYYKNYRANLDSINSLSQKAKIQQRMAQFDFSKKEDSLKYFQRLTAEKLTQKTLLADRQRQSLLISQQKLNLANRQQELAHLGFLKTQADLQAEQNKRKANDQRLKVVKKEQALAQTTVQLQKAEIKSKKLQSYFYIGGLAALIVLSVFIGLSYQNQRKSNALLANANGRISEANKELSEQREEITVQRDRLAETVTDLKMTQQQLIQAEKMASLGELTAGVAHEIQNPLNFVNNFSEVSVELLQELKEEAEVGNTDDVMAIIDDLTQNLEKIHNHGKRADSIVRGMLQHSRTSTGQKELTDINKLVDEYLRLSYQGIKAKDKSFNAETRTVFDAQLPLVNAIPQDIGRVVLNLFNNAFYAVHEKASLANALYKPLVEVLTQNQDGNISISIKDNGTGIPSAIKDKIMQPFFTTKPTGQGTGLGLSLSYDIVVKAHGGKLEVTSEAGEGSVFMITLPV